MTTVHTEPTWQAWPTDQLGKHQLMFRLQKLADVCGWPMRPCKSCGAALAFVPTTAGKMMPVDMSRAENHWGQCPQADQHRRGGGQ